MEKILQEIAAERQRQKALAHGGNTDEFDKDNSQQDWVAYITAYIGRAPQKVLRNQREGQKFRENMLKAAATALAAIEAHDKGYC